MRRDTIFRLASMTKPITAVGAMILVEECKVRLDDPVDRWLPELKDRKVLRTIESPLDDTVPAKRPITLRDLLTFRAGYGEVAFLSPTCPLQKAMMEARLPLTEWLFAGTPDEFMKRLGNLPLAHQPGERWLYHMGCEILGVLIARVSGQSLGSFLRERIFEPLGMKDTGFFVPEAKLDRLPTCYGTDLSTGQLVVLDEARGGQVARPPVFEAGAGGLVSTVDDMAAFGQMMLQQGRLWPRAYPFAALDRAHDPGSPDARAKGGFALLPEFLEGSRLGLRPGGDHRARRSFGRARTFRLGRRLRHVLVRRPERRAGRHTHDAAPSRRARHSLHSLSTSGRRPTN